MNRKISRRQFILASAAGAASLFIPGVTACSSQPQAQPLAQTEAASPVPTRPVAPTRCKLTPLVAPTRPATEPGYTELDPATGLHMTGHPVDIDAGSYRLKVFGKVAHELSLSLDDLRCMPRVSTHSISICQGFFEDRATWAGVPFAYVLDQAGVRPEVSTLFLRGADGYTGVSPIEEARLDGAYLAYEWEGEPIPVLHGFPLRAIYVSEVGNHRVKWLMEIEAA